MTESSKWWKKLGGAAAVGVLTALALVMAGVYGRLLAGQAPAGQALAQAQGVKLSYGQAAVTRTPFQPRRRTATPTAVVPSATATVPPPPPEEPAPAQEEAQLLPSEAQIQGVSGYFQTLGLSCESRSAADWARFFGVSVGELDFQEQLPRSDNPEVGFVGNPRDMAGMIPPRSYGVHAPPVAALLRAYGLPADARRGMSFEDLQREIAAGQPVIVWVVGSVLPGRAVEYTASDGQTTLVAVLEHTVMVVGYNESSVQVVDGGMVYSAGLTRFMDSWGALGNQGVVYGE